MIEPNDGCECNCHFLYSKSGQPCLSCDKCRDIHEVDIRARKTCGNCLGYTGKREGEAGGDYCPECLPLASELTTLRAQLETLKAERDALRNLISRVSCIPFHHNCEKEVDDSPIKKCGACKVEELIDAVIEGKRAAL